MTGYIPRESAPQLEPATGTSVRIYLPDERLRSYATFYYFVDADTPLEDFLYPEWGNVRFTTRGWWLVELGDGYPREPHDALLFGPTDHAARVTCPGGTTMGFGLTPLGWQRLFDQPAGDMANRAVPLDDLFGTPGADLLATLKGHGDDAQGVALFDRLLLDRLEHAPPNPDWAIRIDDILRDRPHSVEDFAAAAGVSEKTLGRMCRRVYGFGAKRLLRRQRFLDTLGQIRLIDTPRYGHLVDPEYFDQAHFIREFHEFMGLSPTAYISAPRPLMGQAAQVQAAAGITLSFKLPPGH
ncbi:MAG: helix-turn-helix domain-containing protein [Pseudomonadota bacterium]